MRELKGFPKALSLFLWLVAIHSFIVGICLIFLPEPVFNAFGLRYIDGDFFRFQGGVFHIVMSLAYGGAAVDVMSNRLLILLSIAAKLFATVFLFGYYFLISNILLIILSGLGDFLMGIIILYLFFKTRKLSEDRKAIRI